ncbi:MULTISPECIES: F0F1 ATP synthase subunit gamma [Vagococcus]|uniref:ATP synthase gamma chain n=1 Tax=Vagococcus fluvialis bH819 TaxID=1255619 RepID=A0A1X6WQ21_9ENTE|nr:MULTISPECIES: F0F1 ATP synthase subunit gamma [Vagococcus]SLM86404.1 ATP synthase gamma chain [Vagococcus fluvialis bH819]HCM89059.1 F0F1 ATP synthase subunit gamma [Vagococcus sp.]
MGASLIDIKKRIASTKKTSQITSAMQMVAASKLTKSEQSSRRFQEYANKVRTITTHLASSQLQAIENADFSSFEDNMEMYHKLLIARPVKKTGYIIITSDKGLAGGYNSSVIKNTIEVLQKDHEDQNEVVIMSIGGTGADFFKHRNIPVSYELRGLSDHPSYNEVRKIVNSAIQMYNNEVFDELYVCYNHHVNTLSSAFRAEKMLPIEDLDSKEATSYEQDYILEPSEDAILNTLLPLYAESLIYGAVLDSKTAEHAARMTAMKSATENASNIIDDLTITFNRARQAAITNEITEIVGGAAALED